MTINPADLPDIESLMRFNTKPKNINSNYNKALLANLPASVREQLKALVKADWRIYCVDSVRGYCQDFHKIITIPTFAIDRGIDYKIWYLCHEMTHAIVGCHHQHDSVFMETLQMICPKNCIHHELGYKPRNAKSAGIGVITMDYI